MAIGPRFPEILEGAKHGHEASFRALYQEFNRPLMRYFRARAPRDAEDLTAEAWLGAARDLHAFEGNEMDFRAWLLRIARELLASQRVDRIQQTNPVPPATLDPLVSQGGPEVLMVESEAAQMVINRILTLLSPDQGEVIVLRLVVGLSITETAAAMNKSAGAIRVLQHRALQRLSTEYSIEGMRL